MNPKVPLAGLEPARPCGQQILSLGCLPFHHSGFPASTRRAVRGEVLQLLPRLSIADLKSIPKRNPVQPGTFI